MSTVDQEFLLTLFQEENACGVKFQQDGMILKGNPQDDRRNFQGSLLLVQHRNGAGSGPHYLVWLPYSYLFCVAPHLVSPAVRRTIDADPEQQQSADASSAQMRIEWMYSICLPVSRIAKMLRKSNLRGKRIVTISRVGGGVECPLIFQEGGVTKFLDEIKKFCTLRQAPSSLDEFIVEGVQEDGAGSAVLAGSASFASPGASSSATQRGGDYRDPTQLQQELYAGVSTPTSKAGALVNSLMSFGANLSSTGSKIAGAVANAIDNTVKSGASVSTSISSSVGDEDSEHLKPIVRNRGTRRMGPALTLSEWNACFDATGCLDPELFAKARLKMFAGGCGTMEVRRLIWPFLLNLYPMSSSLAERHVIDAANKQQFDTLCCQWKSIFPQQEKNFRHYRDVKLAIEKDVVRTDRSHPAFEDDSSPKLAQLHETLLCYAMFNLDLGYCQGMSDMLAVLILIYDEPFMGYAMFRQLLSEKCEGNFRHDVKSNMEKQLKQLQALVRKFVPTLYAHLERNLAENMTFCFRWLLVLFKREFDMEDIFLLWDVLFSSPYTPQFEIFLNAALLKGVSQQVVELNLAYDELLKFTNAMSLRMPVTDCILLAQDFYDLVGAQMAWETKKNGENAFRPKLADVLEALTEAESPRGTPLTKR
jgi:hypothetical protein